MSASELTQRLEAVENKLAFQEQTIEELNQTIVIHEIEMAKMRDQMRLLISRLQAVAPSIIASQEEETPPPHY